MPAANEDITCFFISHYLHVKSLCGVITTTDCQMKVNSLSGKYVSICSLTVAFAYLCTILDIILGMFSGICISTMFLMYSPDT